MATNDRDNPLEVKQLAKKEAWVDCPLCHSRVQTRIEKHVAREDAAWASIAFLLSWIQIGGLSVKVHTFTHYCPNCEGAIAARAPGTRFAQALEGPEIKTHSS